MRVAITSKFVENMTKEEKKACYAFSFSGGQEIFSRSWPVLSDGRLRVFIARCNDKIIGWSTCDMTRTKKRTSSYNWGQNSKSVLWWTDSGYEAAVFVNVRKSFRRKGIGTRLVQKAVDYGRQHKKAVKVFPHDDTSKAFYQKMDVVVGHKTKLRKQVL